MKHDRVMNVSLESLLPSFGDLGNISVFVLAVAAALFYFGKLVGDVKVEQYEKAADYYIQGLFFSLLYIVTPSFLVWLVAGQLHFFSPILVSDLIQLAIAAILSMALQINFLRYTLFSKFKQKFQSQFKEEEKTKPAVSSAVKTASHLGVKDFAEASFKVTNKFSDTVTKTRTLFIMSLLLVWSMHACIRDSQRMRIELLNVKGYPVKFDTDLFRRRVEYDFAEYSIVLEDDFNPDSDWKSLIDILVRIYRVVCEHAGITDIMDTKIKTNLREILGSIGELRINYSNSGVTALDLNEFFKISETLS